MTGANPLDWSANDFLWLYGGMIAAALILRWFIGEWLRPEGTNATLQGEEEIAVLAGGAERLAEAVAAQMLASGSLAIAKGGRFVLQRRHAAASEAERAIMQLGSGAKWRKVRKALEPCFQAVSSRLVARGIWMDGGEAAQVRLLQAVPMLFVLGIGWVRYRVGQLREEDTGFLAMMMLGAAILAIYAIRRLDRATRAGRAELASLRSRHERLNRAPRDHETGLGVALFGTGVLAGTSLSAFHQLRSDTSSGGCSSDGGCGGGGCGGCGD